MDTMQELIDTLKQQIIEALNLEEMTVKDIDTDIPLFMEGLGLDSIDALELTVLLEKKYKLKLHTAEEGKKVLYSVRTMAQFIHDNQKQ